MTEYLFLKLEIIITKFQFELEVSISSFLHPHEKRQRPIQLEPSNLLETYTEI